jgi:phospholipid-binding lipoprotein MlaA
MHRPTRPLAMMIVTAGLALTGCATVEAGAPRTQADPFERLNRSTYAFNDAVDRTVLKPVATAYRRFAPQPVRTGVTNFLSNLSYPTTMVNNALQLKLLAALSDAGRIVLNTTLGLGGLLDPASAAGLARNDEDFGQTLGWWGVPAGPYLMLPLLGPSTLRDGPALYADYLTDARHYIGENDLEFAFTGISIVDRRARLIPAERALEGAFDRYALIRNAYLQRREYLVRDGDMPEDDLEEDLFLDDDEFEESDAAATADD